MSTHYSKLGSCCRARLCQDANTKHGQAAVRVCCAAEACQGVPSPALTVASRDASTWEAPLPPPPSALLKQHRKINCGGLCQRRVLSRWMLNFRRRRRKRQVLLWCCGIVAADETTDGGPTTVLNLANDSRRGAATAAAAPPRPLGAATLRGTWIKCSWH